MNSTANISTLAVVGAGPAGLMAALAAAGAGKRVMVFEQLPEPGVRLLATGGGHCNFTNTLAAEDFIRRFGARRRFVAPALQALDGRRLRRFLEERGVPSHSPDGFHVWPVSDSARSVRDALLQDCRKQGVEFRFNSRVERLQISRGRVTGVMTARGPESASGVVLAAGGASYPGLGGGESGFNLARLAGHVIAPLCPALVPLVTRETWPASLAGVSLARVAVSLESPVRRPKAATVSCSRGGNAVAAGGIHAVTGAATKIEVPMQQGETAAGSLLFTHRGISGPAVLDISGSVAAALMTRPAVGIVLDLTPDWTTEAWQGHLAMLRQERGARTVLSMLASVLPAALAQAVLANGPLGGSRDAAERIVARLSREQSRELIMLIKNLPLTITGTEGFARAMVTKGGVSLAEVFPKTLESRLVRGPFFAGEVLDVDAPCGGFNLQWAFASGFLAARNLGNQ